jgi:bifunctional enzyme CysN/CysC
MSWFGGEPLMDALNNVKIANDYNFTDARFPVQYVNRPNLDFRGFCGTVASGIFHKGDRINRSEQQADRLRDRKKIVR